MRSPSVASIAVAIVAGIAAAGACSESTATVHSGCVPGTVRACETDSGCAVATQECHGDPPTWSDCRCVFTPSTDAGHEPPQEASLPLVGRSCRSDRECDPGTFCLTRASNDLFGGGPPNGICVADCSTDATVCRKFKDATCVRVSASVPATGGGSRDAALDSSDGTVSIPYAPGDASPESGSDASSDASDADPDARPDAPPKIPGVRDAAPTIPDATTPGILDAAPAHVPTSLCMLRCTLGGTAPSKCYGVPHVACSPLPGGSGGDGYCRPLCATDADCSTASSGPSRTCDLRSGVCVTAPPRVDDSLGKTCDSATGTAVLCNGECVAIGAGTSICTHACVLGSAIDCGGSPAGAFLGACLETPPGRSFGDAGYCRKLCDCPADCGASNIACVAFDNPEWERGFNHRGVCTPKTLVTGSALSCSGGAEPRDGG